MKECTDAELIERAQAEPAAFGELYLRYVDAIYSYIYHRVGHGAEAEDLTARTFQRALGNIGSYVDRGAPFGAWLYRIAHNLTANWHRDQARRVTLPIEALDFDGPAFDPAEGMGEQLANRLAAAERLAEALRRLEPERQDLLALKFAQGLSNAEIGSILGRSESAVKSLYHRTLLALRESLNPLDGDAAPPSPSPEIENSDDGLDH